MTVYQLKIETCNGYNCCCRYSSHLIVGIFSSEEKAKEALEDENCPKCKDCNREFCSYEIEKIELDKFIDDPDILDY